MPAITLTRQRGGYLHIIDFMEIPLRLKKLVKRLYFLDTDTNKARNVRSLDTKAIPFKCPGAAVPVRGAEPAGQGSAQQHSGPRECPVVKAWRPLCERPSRLRFD